MEATSTYGNDLARFLFEIGSGVSIVNPSRTKACGRSQLSRTKTDRTDAKTIARFCVALTPALWTPPPIEVEQLQALVHRLDNLKAMRQQEHHRLETADSIVIAAITFCERLLAKGKSKMAVIGAAMHKLLRLVFGVLKSGQPFDPNFLALPS